MKDRLVHLILLGAIALGSVLPWETFAGASTSGLSGDGLIVLVLAVPAAYCACLRWPANLTVRAPLLTAIGGLICLISFVDATSAFAADGVWLTLAAGITWVTYTIASTFVALDEEPITDGS